MLKDRPEDERLEWLRNYAARPAALALLEEHVKSTLAAHEAAPSAATALAHAKALALHGELDAAAKFLEGKIPGYRACLGPSALPDRLRLEGPARDALATSLPTLGSPWLWSEWLQVRTREVGDLPALVESTMNAVAGSGPAAR